jgi:hypothetical protein
MDDDLDISDLPDSTDREYWLRATPEERLLALELMRRAKYGNEACTARMKKVLTIAQLGDE